MNEPGSPALAALVPRPEIPLGEPEVLTLALVALVLTGFFALLRSALLHSVPGRVIEHAGSPERAATLRGLLDKAESLATSATIFEITFQILFVVLVLAAIGGEAGSWTPLGVALLVSVPVLVFAGQVFPAALRGERSDALLRSVLPAFDVVQTPLAALIYGLEATRRGTMRLLRIPEKPRAARRIVEDLRDVVEESDLEGDLDQTERELIENVIEFHDADVAEIMTPRTELRAVEIGSGVGELVRTIAKTGHTRIPIYEGSLDTIVGLAYAQEALAAVAAHGLEKSDLRALLRPVTFVPETKLVSELLVEFRRDKQKTAVVLDEYGGTSGLVTMGDVVAEIVGDVREELGQAEPASVRRLENGDAEVRATTRVSDVNEELELDLPEEEDYETLAGYVLAELGHLPKRGESFERGGVRFVVSEASDRRVLSVRVHRPRSQAG